MTRSLDVHLTLSDKVYNDVVSPARKNNTLEHLVAKCLEIYSISPEMKQLVDSLAIKESKEDIESLINSLNAHVGDMGVDLAAAESALSRPIDTPVSPADDSPRIRELESKVSELSGQMRAVLGILSKGSIPTLPVVPQESEEDTWSLDDSEDKPEPKKVAPPPVKVVEDVKPTPRRAEPDSHPAEIDDSVSEDVAFDFLGSLTGDN